MHDFQPLRTAPRFAEAPDANSARQTVLLLGGEVKEPQGKETGSVRDPAQHLPPAAERDFREQHLALNRRALTRQQFAQGDHASAILVARGQQKQQVLCRLHAQRPQAQRERVADAAQNGDRRKLGHRATTHSTSTCAPRGNAATPTAARAG
jgi:hypothetical protein